jgi:hypothetical protein
MGEARRRREAKAAGNPWPEDLSKARPHAGQHLGDDGEWHLNQDRHHKIPRMSTATLLAIMGAING